MSVGIGDKYLAIPWSALDIQSKKDSDKVHFLINMDRDQLKNAPTIDKDRWSSLDNPQLSQQLDQFYQSAHRTSMDRMSGSMGGQSRGLSTDRDSSTDVYGNVGTRDTTGAADRDVGRDMGRGDRELTTGAVTDSDKAFDSRRLSKVIGMDITHENEKSGKIQDIVFNNSNGSLLYAIVEFNRHVPDANGKWALLPWRVFNASPEAKGFVVNTDLENLKAVAYDKNSLPIFADRSFAQRINDRFNAGSVYGFVGEGRERAQSAATEMPRISGTIQDISTKDAYGVKDALHLKVKADDGQTYWVHVGPKSFLDQKQVKFNKGDQITVNGAKTFIDREAWILANDISSKGGEVLQLRDDKGTPLWRQMQHDEKSPATAPVGGTDSGRTDTGGSRY
jgi:hypothetical protein